MSRIADPRSLRHPDRVADVLRALADIRRACDEIEESLRVDAPRRRTPRSERGRLDDAVERALREGRTFAEVARELGVSAARIRRVADERNVPTRPRGFQRSGT